MEQYRIAVIFGGGKIFLDMEHFAGSWKKFEVTCTRALMSVARCIYGTMVTVSWVNILWFASQPRKSRKFSSQEQLVYIHCIYNECFDCYNIIYNIL